MIALDIGYVETYIHDLAIAEYVRGPNEDPGRAMWAKGQGVMAGARAQVGVDTGMLRESIHMYAGTDSYGYFVTVEASDPIALWHHQGTPPRMIYPVTHKVMRFSSKGQVVHTHRVAHPGTRANPFLMDPLRRTV